MKSQDNQTCSKSNADLLVAGMDCVEDVAGEEWQPGGSLLREGSILVYGTNGDSNFANSFMSLFVKDNVNLSQFKQCEELFDIHIVQPSNSGNFTTLKFLEIEAHRAANNIEYLCSYLNKGISLVSINEAINFTNQSLRFTKEYLQTILLSQPLTPYVLSSLLKQKKYNPLITELYRLHINKLKEFGYVGIYLDEKIDNIGYTSGRILATMEYIAKLSENREPLKLDYSRFSVSPMSMFSKLLTTSKRYIYTVPRLGRQIFLKSLLDSLLEKTKGYSSTKRYLSDNDQAMFAIGYKHQTEYFADDAFTSKFQILNTMRQPDNVLQKAT